MFRVTRGQIAQSVLSVAISVSVAAAATPRATAQNLDLAAGEAVIEDATSAALVASALAGGPVTITGGTYTISTNGSYTMSFTAGSFVYSDTGTYTPDGSGYPGSGSWALGANGFSTITPSGTMTSTWDPVNMVMNTTFMKNIPLMPNPDYDPNLPEGPNNYALVNDQEGTDIDTPDGESVMTWWYTHFGQKAGPVHNANDQWTPGTLPVIPPDGEWNQYLSGGTSGRITGLWANSGANGTFSGTVNAVPEPTSALLAAIGAVAVIAVTTIQQRRAKESRVVVGQSGPSE
jgi:hypothetical protein